MCGHSLQAQLRLGRQRDELFVGRGLLHLVQDAALGGDDELLRLALTAYLSSAVVEPMKSRVAQDRLLALGVRDELGVGVPLEEPDELPLAEGLVDDAAALPQHASCGRASSR